MLVLLFVRLSWVWIDQASTHLKEHNICTSRRLFFFYYLFRSLELSRLASSYPIHIWIFTSCQTSLKTALNMVTNYRTKCLLCEPAPDYGGVLWSTQEQCWQGQLALDRDPQGKLIQGEGTKKVQSEKRLLESQVLDQDSALWIMQQNCFPCDLNPDKQTTMIKAKDKIQMLLIWQVLYGCVSGSYDWLLLIAAAFICRMTINSMDSSFVPIYSWRHSASPVVALLSGNTISHMLSCQCGI